MKLTTNQILQKGIAAHQKGEINEAIKFYNDILYIEPDNLDANNNLGIALIKLSKLDEAAICFKKVLNVNPDLAVVHHNLGRVLLETDKLNEAEASFIRAKEIKSDYFSAYNNLGIIYVKFQKFEKAESNFLKALELKPDYPNAQFGLGITFHNLDRLDDAISCFKKTLELEPNHFDACYSLGVSLLALGKLDNAEVSFKNALKMKPDSFDAHNGLGNIYIELGKLEEAEISLRKALTINPNYDLARYNLGLALFTMSKFAKASKEFGLINYKNSKEFVLRCLFELNEQSNFDNHLINLSSKEMNNALIGSLISRASIKYGVNKSNPFCNDPLNYVFKTELISQCNFKNIFVKNINDILCDNNVKKRQQTLLTHGVQTSGNVFLQKGTGIDEIRKILYLEIEKYRTYFQDSNEGFLKNWPTDYYINGWIVSMKSGGNLSPHMHELGWVSGSVYINVPPKLKIDSGNLVVCIDDVVLEKDKNTQKIIDVVTGSLCLFPSSLLHYTIPFESIEDRVVLAFDVMPK